MVAYVVVQVVKRWNSPSGVLPPDDTFYGIPN